MTATTLGETKNFEIGGRNFQIGMLSYADSKRAFQHVCKLMPADESLPGELGMGLFMYASTFGGIPDEELDFFIKLFGPITMMAVSPTNAIPLSSEANREIAFKGRFEEMFEWLDAALQTNFASVIEKLNAAQKRFTAKVQREAAAKAEPKSTPA